MNTNKNTKKTIIVNQFEAQMCDAKKGWQVKVVKKEQNDNNKSNKTGE